MHPTVATLAFGALDLGDAQLRTKRLTKGRHRKLVERRIKAPEYRHDVAVPVVDAVQIIDASEIVGQAGNGDNRPAELSEFFGLSLTPRIHAAQGAKIFPFLVPESARFITLQGAFEQIQCDEEALQIPGRRVRATAGE